MKKTYMIALVCVVVLACSLCLAACNSQPNSDDSTTTTGSYEGTNSRADNDATELTEAPEFLATGGDGDMYYERAYNDKIYGVTGRLIDYIEKSTGRDYMAWSQEVTNKTKSLKYTLSSPSYTPRILLVIEEFDISKTDFERINNEGIEYLESIDEDPFSLGCYTQEEIDALYSGDPSRITEVFATEYAIIKDGQAFAPKFYLNATESELSSYGITDKMVSAKTNVLLADSIIERNEVK